MPIDPTVLVCALHPLPDVRRHVLSRCPAGLPVHEAATVAELTALPPARLLVVLLDPARTAPAEVRSACVVVPELVSISELRLPAGEVGVDAVLPLRRMTEHELSRLLFDVTDRPALTAAR